LLTQDAIRSARLSFSSELLNGTITEAELAARTDVISAFCSRSVPRAKVRIAQRLAMKAGLLDFDSSFLSSVLGARRAMLGAQAEAPPRFLIRVDEFPIAGALDAPDRGLPACKAFHETLAAEGVPYLMAIVPQHPHRYLDPAATGGRALGAEDCAFIEQMRHQGVTFAQHGTTHRTRHASPRRRSELSGLRPEELEAVIADGRDRLAQVGVFPRVLIPPFNRFDPTQFSELARYFDVIGGGPESVPLIGLHGSPQWRGDAVYLPCYSPYYACAAELSPVIDRVIALAPGTWIPLVLHVAWEINDRYRSLAAFARKVAPYAAAWQDFLQAVDTSRAPSRTQPAVAPSERS